MDPITYDTQVQQPIAAAAQGYQLGAGIRDDQFKQQQQQAALAQQQQQAAVINKLISNPNASAQDYANATLLVPALREQFGQAWTTKSAAQTQSHISDLSQWGAAIQQGQPKIASDAMRARADAMDSTSGQPTQASQAMRHQADAIDAHPDFAGVMIKSLLAAQGEQGMKVVDQLRNLGNDAANSKKITADADLARTQADVAAGTAPAKIVEATLTNDKTLQEIAASKLTGRVAELNTQIGQANSETERGKLVLERDKLVQQQQQQKQAQGLAAQEGMDSTTQALQTVDLIKKHPGMQDAWWQSIWGVPGSKPGDTWGAAMAKMPGTERHALDGWVDSLKGQLGYQSLMAAKASSPTGASGFGALSEGELKLLSGLAANLDTNSKDFPKQLAAVEHYLQKTQSTAAAGGKLPTAGGAFVVSSPKYGDIKESDINRLMIAHPGTTREQVLQFLQGAQ